MKTLKIVLVFIGVGFFAFTNARAQYIDPTGNWNSTSGSSFKVWTTYNGIEYKNYSTGEIVKAGSAGYNTYQADFYYGYQKTETIIIEVLSSSAIKAFSYASGQTTYWEKETQIYDCGILTSRFNFYYASQNSPHWCWAACIQMVFNYYGVYLSQEDIVNRTYGTDNWGYLPDWSASISTIHNNLNNWDFDRDGDIYSVSASLYWGAPSTTYLVNELSDERPVLIGYNTGQSQHAVLITACTYSIENNAPVIHTLTVRDPWPGQGKVTYDGYELASRIDAHWYIRVNTY